MLLDIFRQLVNIAVRFANYICRYLSPLWRGRGEC